MKRRFGWRILAAATLAGVTFCAGAQGYPAKPIRIIVPYTPAGTTDILARAVGQKLSEAWGQVVVVDNRPGANGSIGTEVAARSNPDGHTLLMGTIATQSINQSLYRLQYDPVRDFAAISLVARVPNMLVLHPSVPAKSVRELIDYAKAHPGKLNFGSPGNGSSAHLSAELFKLMTGAQMTHVPYKGSAGVLADLMAGQLSLAIDNMPVYLPQVKAGKIRALAVTTAKRSPAAPELPTMAEAGLPGYETSSWFGLLAPAGVSKAIVAKLAQETARILKLPDVNERLSSQGAEPVGGTPAEFDKFIRAETVRWAKVVKDAGARVE